MNKEELHQEEAEQLVEHWEWLAEYWANVKDYSEKDKLIGLVHSILVDIDGQHVGRKAINLSYGHGVFNKSIMLHDLIRRQQ